MVNPKRKKYAVDTSNHAVDTSESSDNDSINNQSWMQSPDIQTSQHQVHHHPVAWISRAEKCFKVGSLT